MHFKTVKETAEKTGKVWYLSFSNLAGKGFSNPGCQILDFRLTFSSILGSVTFPWRVGLARVKPWILCRASVCFFGPIKKELKEINEASWLFLLSLGLVSFSFGNVFPEELYLHYCGLNAATFWLFTLYWTSVSISDIKETCPNILNLEHIEESPF